MSIPIEISNFSDFFYNWQEIFLENLENQEKDEKTYENYQRVTNFFIEYLIEKKTIQNTDELNHRVIQNFIKYQESIAVRKKDGKKFTYWTKSNYKKVLKLFLDFIEDDSDDKYIFNIKWKRVEFKKNITIKKHINNKDQQTIITYLNNILTRTKKIKDFTKLNKKLSKEMKNKEYVYMLNLTFKIGLYAGLRASEICDLKLENFSKPYLSSTNTQLINIQVFGKGNKERIIPIVYSKVKNELLFYSKIRSKNEDIFRTIRGVKLTRTSLYNYFDEVSINSGTNQRGVHIIRHTFAQKMSDAGIDLADAQDMLGHSDPSITRIYFKRNQGRMENVATKIS